MTADTRSKLTPQDRARKREIFKMAKPAVGIKRGDTVRGRVYNVIDEGAFILTEENFIGFIHASEAARPIKNGMTVEGRVTFVRADGRLNLSLRPPKELAMAADAEKIKTYLEQRGGSMPFNDQTPPEVIKEKFGISKAAFKRALGRLLKEGIIREEEGWINLLKRDT